MLDWTKPGPQTHSPEDDQWEDLHEHLREYHPHLADRLADQQFPLHWVPTDKFKPQTYREPEYVRDLAASMKEGKPVHPAFTWGGNIEDGNHRIAAAQQAGLKHVPVIEYDDVVRQLSGVKKAEPSSRKKDFTRVAAVAAFDDHGRLLFGLRGDGRGWCLPGGHFEPGEDPVVAARRELVEETGLLAPHLSYLGSDVGNKPDLSIWCFRANDVEGEPDAGGDPDGEFVEFRWVHPEAIPEEIRSNLRDRPNVVLDLLGVDYGEPPKMSKAEPGQYFRSKDGIRIPVNGTPERRAWNRKYLQGVADAFSGGNLGGLRSIKVPLADPGLQGSNMAVNQDRLRLYRRMLSAGDRLPPVVVQRAGQGWKLLDGNHRLEAARALGHSQLHAVEVGVAGGGETE